MKKKNVAVFDIDGVIADCEGKFCEDFGTDNRHLYDFCVRYPKVDPELIKEWLLNPETYRDLTPIFGGITLLNEFKSRGFHILLLTARDKSLLKVTTDWLKKYHINYDEIYFGKNKVEIIRDYQHLNANKKISVVVDDSYDNCKTLRSNFKFPVVCWKQPWNNYVDSFPHAYYNDDTMISIIDHGNGRQPFWSNK